LKLKEKKSCVKLLKKNVAKRVLAMEGKIDISSLR
jgi:hypothetical protein